jgi:glycosyltransferase involved in cell wall biosynthesis
MRIGLLTTSFPRREADVPGAFVLGFARALSARGHQLTVLAPEPAEREFSAPPRFSGIAVHWVRYLVPRSLERTFYGAGVLDNLRRDPRAALGLAPFVVALTAQAAGRARGWDAVVSHWALPCALIAGWLGVPHLAVLHSADVFLLERLPQRRRLARHIARGADELLFSSRALRERFLALLRPLERAELGARCHVCAMGIEASAPPRRGESSGPSRRSELGPPSKRSELNAPSGRDAARRELGLNGFSVLSMGRLIELKGIEHAIDALVALPEVELIVAGEGPLRARLEQRARRARARVRFVGEIHGAAKHTWLSAADAFVLPSVVLPSGRSEGVPGCLLEAMDHGLPVVASDVGGVSDVVQAERNGLLVPPADAGALAAALTRLSDRKLRAALGREARKTAALYHWDVLAPRIEELLLGR